MSEKDLEITFVESPHYSMKGDKQNKLIIIHWVSGTFQSCVSWFSMDQSKVSAHYVISREGKVVQMVDEKNVAWHAGSSYHIDFGAKLNNCSIGIELEGPPSKLNEIVWRKEQLDACILLCKQIQSRYPEIKITDHSSICLPKGRKEDVKLGYGVDAFPWPEFVKSTGIEEAV